MKTLTCLRDLEPYGIFPLTGEACALSMRILCDLSHVGRRIVRECLGLPIPIIPAAPGVQLAEPWNSSTRGVQHVASIMLYPDMWLPLAVTALAIVDNLPTILLVKKNYPSIVGLTASEQFTQATYKTAGKEDSIGGSERDQWIIDQPAKYYNLHCERFLNWESEMYGEIQRMYRHAGTSNPSQQPTAGTRNVHAMTGRAV